MSAEWIISSDNDYDFIKNIKQRGRSSHTLTLISLALIDNNYPDLTIKVTVESSFDQEFILDYVKSIYGKSNNNKVNGNANLTSVFKKEKPKDIGDYNGCKTVIVEEKTDNTIVLSYYRLNEANPRTLTIIF